MNEKRLATLLYADISGFTGLTNKIGAEKTTDFINECFNTIDLIIHSHYGTIVRHEGDRVVAIFGFPRSYGNDSRNALWSALKIQEAMKKMRYQVDVHIGVGTGEILILGEEIYGHLFDEVSHLEEIAEKGQILVNEECYYINKDYFLFEKSKEGFQVKEKIIPGVTFPFFFEYRSEEFEKIYNALLKIPKFIIISGDMGIGKTVFINEAINRINKNNIFNVYETTFNEQDYLIPCSAFMKIVYQISPDFTLPPGEENYKFKLFREMLSVFIQSSKTKPVIIILKNVEVIDEHSLSFLEYLKGNIQNNKITIIIEVRDKNLPIIEKIIGDIKKSVEFIELKPLPDCAILDIVAYHLKDYVITDEFKKDIVNLCRGNPYYAMEISILIKNSFPLGSELKKLPNSWRIKEITEAIVDSIPKNYLKGLCILSLINDEIDYQIILKLLPDANEFLNYCLNRGLLYYKDSKIYFNSDTLRECIGTRLTKKNRQEIHLKIADALKENANQLGSYGLIAFHLKEAGEIKEAYIFLRKWADYLEKELSYEKCLSVYNELLDLVTTNEDEKCELLIKKINLLHLIGERNEELKTINDLYELAVKINNLDYQRKAMLKQAEYFEAIADYDSALEILNRLNKEKQETLILERMGINYYNKNEISQALRIFNLALDSMKESDNYKLIGNILKGVGLCYWKLGDKEQALIYYSKAKTMYEKGEDKIALSRLNVNIANVYYYLNKFEQSLIYYKDALNIARKINDSLFVAQILSNIGGVYIQFGEYEEALKNFQEALEIDRKKLNRKGEAIRLSNIGHIYGVLGDIEKAFECFMQALQIDESIKNKSGMAIRYGNIATCSLQSGKYDEAVRYLTNAIDISKEIGSKEYLAYYHNLLGFVYLQMCQLNYAEEELKIALSLAREVKNPSYEIISQSYYALLWLKRDDIKKAFQYSNWAVEKLLSLQEIEGDKEQIYYTHYKILNKINKSNEAYKFLKFAYDIVVFRAQKIKNLEYQKKFLNLSRNKEIIEEWKKIEKRG
ncbi:MAG: tetratricopeptide repeat protein [candidate division WOR-3 bacterium]